MASKLGNHRGNRSCRVLYFLLAVSASLVPCQGLSFAGGAKTKNNGTRIPQGWANGQQPRSPPGSDGKTPVKTPCQRSQCPSWSTCVNLWDGSFSCVCPGTMPGTAKNCSCLPGYESNHQSQCTDIDECGESTHSCHQLASCTNTQGSFTCACPSWLTGDGMTCHCGHGYSVNKKGTGCVVNGNGGSGISDCRTTTACHPLASCVDVLGSFQCACQRGSSGNGTSCACLAGYHGNGMSCVDVDECLIASSCHHLADCTNNAGSFKCQCRHRNNGTACACPQGYRDNGTACVDRDECGEGMCATGYHGCVNTAPGYHCVCNKGYLYTASGCVDIDECSQGNGSCPAAFVCQNTPGKFLCNTACSAGYELDAMRLYCQDIDECLQDKHNNCTNQTTTSHCQNTNGSYLCACHVGFRGSRCEQDVNECAESQSLCTAVNTMCGNSVGSYACRCLPGHVTSNGVCQSVADPCSDGVHTCHSLATCTVHHNGSFACECATGYQGDGQSCTDISAALVSSSLLVPVGAGLAAVALLLVALVIISMRKAVVKRSRQIRTPLQYCGSAGDPVMRSEENDYSTSSATGYPSLRTYTGQSRCSYVSQSSTGGKSMSAESSPDLSRRMSLGEVFDVGKGQSRPTVFLTSVDGTMITSDMDIALQQTGLADNGHMRLSSLLSDTGSYLSGLEVMPEGSMPAEPLQLSRQPGGDPDDAGDDKDYLYGNNNDEEGHDVANSGYTWNEGAAFGATDEPLYRSLEVDDGDYVADMFLPVGCPSLPRRSLPHMQLDKLDETLASSQYDSVAGRKTNWPSAKEADYADAGQPGSKVSNWLDRVKGVGDTGGGTPTRRCRFTSVSNVLRSAGRPRFSRELASTDSRASTGGMKTDISMYSDPVIPVMSTPQPQPQAQPELYERALQIRSDMTADKDPPTPGSPRRMASRTAIIQSDASSASPERGHELAMRGVVSMTNSGDIWSRNQYASMKKSPSPSPATTRTRRPSTTERCQPSPVDSDTDYENDGNDELADELHTPYEVLSAVTIGERCDRSDTSITQETLADFGTDTYHNAGMLSERARRSTLSRVAVDGLQPGCRARTFTTQSAISTALMEEDNRQPRHGYCNKQQAQSAVDNAVYSSAVEDDYGVIET